MPKTFTRNRKVPYISGMGARRASFLNDHAGGITRKSSICGTGMFSLTK